MLARYLLEKKLVNVVRGGVELGNKIFVCIQMNVLQRRGIHWLFGKQLSLELYIFSTKIAAVEVVDLLYWLASVYVELILPAHKQCLVWL